MLKGVDFFLLRNKNFIGYCFRLFSLKKKQLRKKMIAVHKSMTPHRDRGTASGRQLQKGSGGWLSRTGIVASITEEVIWSTKVCRER